MNKTTRSLICVCVITCALVGCEDGSKDQRDVDSYVTSAQLFMNQGQYRAALIEIKNILQIEPKNESAFVLSAKISLSLGNARTAYRQLELNGGEGYEYYETLIEAYIQGRKYSTALHTLRQQVAIFESRPTTEKLFKARIFAGLRQIVEAEALFDEVLLTEPDNLDARMGKVSMLAVRGDLEAAESRIEDLLADQPNYVPALEWLSAIYIQQGRLELAEDTLTQTISALPTSDIYTRERASVLRTLITLLARQGRAGEALVYQRLLADAFPQAQEVKQKYQDALGSIQSGEFAEAEKILVELYEMAPGNQTGGTLLGLLHFVQGRDRQAYRYFNEAVDAETTPARILEAMASNLMRMDKPERVLEVLESKVKDTRNSQILILYGVAAISVGRTEEGVASLEQAIALYPKNVRQRILLASYYNGLSPPDYDAALKVVELGHKIAPKDPEAGVALINQLLTMGHQDQAQEIAMDQARDYPDDPDANLIAGAYWLSVGETLKARKFYKTAIHLYPDGKTAMFGLAESYMRDAQWIEARSAYQKIFELDETDRGAIRGILNTYIKAGRTEAGVDELQKMSGGENETIATAILEYYMKVNSLEKASSQLTRFVQEFPESTEIERLSAGIDYKRALKAYEEQDYNAARELIFNSLAAYPMNPILLETLVSIELRSGQLREAEKVIADIEKEYPSSVLAHKVSGDLAVAQKDYAKALRSYLAAWKIQPKDSLGSKIMMMYSVMNSKTEAEAFAVEWKHKIPVSQIAIVSRVALEPENNARAIAIYEEQEAEFPDVPAILNNLAWYYFLEGKISQGLEKAEKAHNLAPASASVADTYGWLLYQSGDSTKSRLLLEKAIELAPNDVEIQNHLKVVLGNSD